MKKQSKCKDTHHNFNPIGNETEVKIFCTKCGEIREVLKKS
jgi:hypothetical protein